MFKMIICIPLCGKIEQFKKSNIEKNVKCKNAADASSVCIFWL